MRSGEETDEIRAVKCLSGWLKTEEGRREEGEEEGK